MNNKNYALVALINAITLKKRFQAFEFVGKLVVQVSSRIEERDLHIF